jgi:hypothetical protein
MQNNSSEKDSYIGMMVEKMSDKIDLMVEDREVLHARIDRLDGRMGKLEVQVESIEIKVDHLGERFDGMEVKFDVLAENLSQKADKKDVIALVHRVTKLEAH